MNSARDLDDEVLVERVTTQIISELGDAVRIESRRAPDGYFQLSVFDPDVSTPVLWLYVNGGQIHITDENVVSEESDDLGPDVDRASWASEMVTNLGRLGATRLTHNRWLPNSFNRLHIWQSDQERFRTLQSTKGRVVSELPPFAVRRL